MGQKPHFDWYIHDWMALKDWNQADLQRAANWSKRKASDLLSGKQRYNRDTLNEAAWVLDARPFELLLHPSVAMEYRQLHEAVRLVAERKVDFNSEPAEFGRAGNG